MIDSEKILRLRALCQRERQAFAVGEIDSRYKAGESDMKAKQLILGRSVVLSDFRPALTAQLGSGTGEVMTACFSTTSKQ
jgi:hypothetical protein